MLMLVYFLRMQLISLCPFPALLTPPPLYQTGRGMHISGLTIFMVYFILLLEYYILVGNTFSSVQSKQLFCLTSPVKGRSVNLLLLKKKKATLEANVEMADKSKL